MRRRTGVKAAAVCCMAVFILAGCVQQPKTASSNEAVNQAKQLETVEAQVKFLVKEANAFVSSEKFDEAIKTAKYVLSELDQNSLEAKTIIEKAQAELKRMAEEKAQEMKDKLGAFGQ